MRRVNNSQRPSRPRDWTGNLFFFIPFLLVLLSQKVIDDAVGRTYLDNDSYTLPLEDEKDSELLTLRPINDAIIPKSAENTLSTDKIINMDDVSKIKATRKIATNKVEVLKTDHPWLIIKTARYQRKELSEIEEVGQEEEVGFLDLHDPPFQRYENVVITTKVHWPDDLGQLKRMLCTLHAAYNRFVNYDVLVFTTMPWTDEQVDSLAKVISPARLTVSIDGPPLEEQLASMSEKQVKFLEKRCDVKPGENITWFHHCKEVNYTNPSNLAYAWQSEFRAYHIHKHPVMQQYKWMIWMDSDALCTKTWERDPIKVAVENNLTALYDNFPAGSTKGMDLKAKMVEAYGKSICGIWETNDGHWRTRDCLPQHVSWVVQIHGFHHITNLKVYRSTRALKFLELITGDYRFSRKWDDQLGITVPAAFEAPDRVWDLRKHNMTWMIRHNGEYDGKDRFKIQNVKKWWINEGRNWTAGRLFCDRCINPGATTSAAT